MRYLTEILDYLAIRYLGYRGLRNLQCGYPTVATFAFDYIGHAINVKGRYEGAELQMACEFLRESGCTLDVALDVGANVGNHSLFFAEHFKQVFAFEPNPRVFQLLCFNAVLRPNIQTMNIGASNVRGSMELVFDELNWGGGRILEATRDDPNAISVMVNKLDDLPDLARCEIGLIKIDVEGHELRVLEGARSLVLRSRPAIMFEQHAAEIRSDSSEVIDWLRGHGYARFYEVRASPGLPRAWQFRGRKLINGLLRLIMGEHKSVVEIKRFENVFYPMIIALPPKNE